MSIRRRNRINEQFSPRLIEMLEAPSYRALSRSAHLVISRIEIELGAHGGNDNGRLPVTTDDFVSLWHASCGGCPGYSRSRSPRFHPRHRTRARRQC